MDKSGGASRGAERFSTAKHKLFHGFHSNKSKRKLRSLTALGGAISCYQNHKMGCDISGNEDTFPALSPSSNVIASNRPEKFSYDCNRIHHVSVPRKSRSAMKKRNRESFLLDSEKPSHTMNGIESPKKYGIKKSKKQGSTNWSPITTVSGPITKDEEEVVETLYALAGMFPHNCSNSRRPLVGESLPESSSVLQVLQEGTKTAFEDSGGTAANPSLLERSTVEAAKTSFLSEIVDQELPDLPEGANILMGSVNIASKMNRQNVPLLVGIENANKVDSSLARRLKKPRESLISHIERRPEMALEKAIGDECKQEQHMIKHRKKNEGSALWPGLSPVASSGSHASFLQSAAAKHPDWLDAAICSSKKDLMESNSSGGKISEVVIHKSPWKRCAAHVHIGHLIQSLQVPNTGMLMQQPNQSNHNPAQEGPKHESHMEVHDLKGMRNGNFFAPEIVHSATMKNSHETKKRLSHHKLQAVPTPGAYDLQKQSFDLSLTAGGGEVEVNDGSKKVGRRLEPFSKLQVPYFHSLAQQHDGLMSLPMLHSQHTSTSYLDRASVVAPQLPHYYCCPSSGTHSNWKAPKKQELQGLGFWTAQVPRGPINCNTTRTQFPNWQSRKQDSPAVSPCGGVIFPHSPAALEALGSTKITPISRQQQQQLIALSSFPPSRTTGLHFLPSSVVEENRARFHIPTSATSSLHLLCDDRI
ncbi:uncharacterized protein G2W53_011907 [Senna tora]|uniref:Uncharacterized protein n=1 Tax=Senna tora TaxID=362788 RepID=A0A834U3F9_9FABA|nr:uncharacterized protein G2W53_011907 [Senna tora]